MSSNVRFLDQVSVSTYSTTGAGSIDTGSLLVTASAITNGILFEKGDTSTFSVFVTGSQGPSGSAGPSGSSGPEGNLAVWRYDSNTSINDPGAGYFRIDTAWSSNLTSKLSVDDVSFSPQINLGSVLNSITPNSILKITSLTNPDIFKYLQITGIAPFQSGYEVYDVTALASSGSPSTDDQFGISIPAPAANSVSILEDGSQVVTAVTSINFSGSGFQVVDDGGNAVTVIASSAFPYTGSAQITGSLIVTGSGTESPFLITMPNSNGDTNKMQINNEGTLVLGKFNTTPTAVTGGMFYSSSNEFYLGFS